MTVETEISTPVDNTIEDTSSNAEPAETTDTPAPEPEIAGTTAETETSTATQEPKSDILYAGKYKTVEELEKGYNEAQKFVTKANEWETKYNDLLAKQTAEIEKAQALRLQEAQTRGYNSYEEQQIAEQIQVAEFEQFVNNLNQVPAEHLETVRELLLQYYNTAHPDFLNEAKRYYPSNFIEKAALDKSRLQNNLMSDFRNKQAQADEQRVAKLAGELKEAFSEFLSDISTNTGKATALKSFCDVGSINSKEDMQAFQEIYSQVAKYEREQAIKELEAAKIINDTKNKAVINSGSGALTLSAGLKDTYTSQEIGAMSQEEYNALCDKYGEDELYKRII